MNDSPLTIKQLYRKFIHLEEIRQLFSQKIDNILFWERIRYHAYGRIFNKRVAIISATKANSTPSTRRKLHIYLLKIKSYICAFSQFYRNPFFTRKKDILILGSPRRKLQDNGTWWDIYTDHFIDKIGFSTISVESDYSFQHFYPPQTKNLKYFTFIDVMVEIKRVLRLQKVRFTAEEDLFLTKLNKVFFDTFGVNIDLKTLTFDILTKRKRVLSFYLQLLKIVKPKVVIVICSYGKENFIEACKILRIPVIELQHGVISRYGIAYSYENPSATKNTFPDYLFTFGEFWKQGSAHFPILDDKIVPVGYAELEILKEKYSHVKKENQILFISQQTIGVKLSKIAIEMSTKQDLGYTIVYKLHPAECLNWKENYPWLVNSNVKVVDHLGDNLYKLFTQSSVLVGGYSTAVFEGLSFGLRTFILDTTGIEYMDDILLRGYATKIKETSDLLEKIHKKQEKMIDPEYFFKNNSIKNIENGIKEVISRYYP